MSRKPKNWPPALPYLTAPLHDKRLSRAQRQALTTATSTTSTTTSPAAMAMIPAAWTASPAGNVRIQAITDPDHPACGQHGLFAAQDLPPGAFVVVYLGRVHPGSTTKTNTTLAAAAAAAADTITTTTTTNPNTNAASNSQESGPGQGGGGGSGGEESAAVVEPESTGTGTGTSGDYDLWLDREVDVAVDAEREGNEARFVNDYRGVRERPNAEFGNGWCERWGQVCVGVWVVKEGKHRNKNKNKDKDGGKGHGRQDEEEEEGKKKKKNGGGGGGARKRGSGIRKGDEILVSYGKGFWGGRQPSASLS